ncbi:MAG: response regulator transcription factor [Acidobacteria bacterium]|nr:response regulator transcription factor [Acidobacteriota bacterium]MBV9478241.1 response regulator transcription factor [Acidobacteriota bacterium]
MIRTAIIDDEPIARDRLRRLLHAHRDVDVVAEFEGAAETVERWHEHDAAMVFVDIRLGEDWGFDVIRRVNAAGAFTPAIIVATAHREHGQEAFEVGAIDYLVKPFDSARLSIAMSRARRWLAEQFTGAGRDEPLPARIAVRQRNRMRVIHISEIDWLESADNYLELHVGGETLLYRATIAQFAEGYADHFVRVSRSTLVNLDRISVVLPTADGDCEVLLHDGTTLALRAPYRANLRARIPGFY